MEDFAMPSMASLSPVEETMREAKDEMPPLPLEGGQRIPPYRALPHTRQLAWHKLLPLLLLHGLALVALLTFHQIKWQTQLVTSLSMFCICSSVTVGAHRLWAHRTFTASFGLRLLLAFFFTMSFQETVYDWVRDHRAHHKWTDTDADPYNSRRGFFFSHIGWLLVKKHPEVIRKGKSIDMSDIEADPILAFQRRWYFPLLLCIGFLLPTTLHVTLWGEPLVNALLMVIYQIAGTLNITWLVNSWAHLYGYRPYDSRISPVEATIRHVMVGEGFHNYHHAFPCDYSASELGPGDVFNPATAFINLCAYSGLASNLKRASGTVVKAKANTVGGKDLVYMGNFTKEWIGGVLTFLTLTILVPLTLSHTFKYTLRAMSPYY